MKVIFGKDSIEYSINNDKKTYSLLEFNQTQLVEILEDCVSNEADLEFVSADSISPFAQKLKELIEIAFCNND